MIKNERQLRISKSQVEKFLLAFESFDSVQISKGAHPALIQAEKEAILSQYESLRSQVEEYEKLKSGVYDKIEFHSFEQLPVGLIKARIATGLSQKDLAVRLGLKEQQIQRYESENYRTASFSRLLKIIKALGVIVNEEILISEDVISKNRLVNSIDKLGISMKVVLDRILPKNLASALMDLDSNIGGYSIRIREAAGLLSRVFGVSEAGLLDGGDKSFDLSHAMAVRYKKPKNVSANQISAYSFYTNYLALTLLNACKGLPQQRVPETAFDVRNEILEKFGQINFDTVLDYVWYLGIPVLPLTDSVSFHGACWRVNGNNVIALKKNTNSGSRWMFDLLHELCHAKSYPDQDSFEYIEEDEISVKNELNEEEEEANEFAMEVILGEDAYDLAYECVVRAKANLRRLKRVVSEVALEKSVDLGTLANQLAHLLQEDQDVNWWGTANNLQSDVGYWKSTKKLVLGNSDWNKINDLDRDLVLRALE